MSGSLIAKAVFDQWCERSCKRKFFIICLMRTLVRNSDRSLPLFLGSETATLTAVSRLAKMAKARILPCYTHRLPANAGYEVVVLPPITPFPSDDAVADATLVNQAVGVGILQVPEQYMWTLRMFKSRSSGGQSPYNY